MKAPPEPVGEVSFMRPWRIMKMYQMLPEANCNSCSHSLLICPQLRPARQHTNGGLQAQLRPQSPALPRHWSALLTGSRPRRHSCTWLQMPRTVTPAALRAKELSTNNVKNNPIRALLISPFPLVGEESNQLPTWGVVYLMVSNGI